MLSQAVCHRNRRKIILFFGDFVRSTGRDFDDALALSMGLRRVSGKVIGRVAGMSVVVVSWSKSLFSS